jgi:acyl-CoA reductase-like NAD-dependent aldehyde dehydrogenase
MEQEKIAVFDKYTGEYIDSVQLATQKELSHQINLSEKAFEITKKISITSKESLLNAIVDVLERNKNELANLIMREAGKPLFYAFNEIERCIRTTQAGLQALDLPETEKLAINLSQTPHNYAATKRFPIGPILGIAPFNFPLNLAMHKIIPCLCSGNTLIIKPSPLAPLTLNYFINELLSPLLPVDNWIQIAHCSDEDAEFMVIDERFKMVSFTGSAAVGWHIKNNCGKKKIALELGGNAAVYVHHDADISTVAEKCAFGAFLYAGQICISTQRIYVEQSIAETFIQKLIEASQKCSSGNPADNPINGPLISSVHLDRIKTWINEACDQGAKLLCGGYEQNHNVFAPTLLTQTKKGMKVYDEEVFGPLAIVESVSSVKEAIHRINETRYGLQCGIFTNDKQVINELYDEIDCGGIIVNNIPGFRVDDMPYGGIKDSGLGREGIRYAIEESTELKLLIE